MEAKQTSYLVAQSSSTIETIGIGQSREFGPFAADIWFGVYDAITLGERKAKGSVDRGTITSRGFLPMDIRCSARKGVMFSSAIPETTLA